MIVFLHDYSTRKPKEMEVPDEPVHGFVRWLLETNAWRSETEMVVERAMKLRKKLLAAATAPTAPAPAEPIEV